MTTYKVLCFFQREGKRPQVMAKGLTREEAKEMVNDLNGSSATAWKTSAVKRTKRYGAWFLGFAEEA